MKKWLLALRPKTLTAAVVPVFVGTALAYSEGVTWSFEVLLLTLIASFAIQIATNLFNDVIDFKKGSDRADRKGPQRVTQSGLIAPELVMKVACMALVVAFICGLPLVLRGGWVIVSIGLVSLVLAYAYTGGPLPLAYRGLGDLFVILFFGVIAVSGVYYLHTLQFSWSSIVAGLQVGFWATVLLVINNLRDVEEDKISNKKTLVVRFGKEFGKVEIIALVSCSFLFCAYWFMIDSFWAGTLPLLLIPIAMRLCIEIKNSEPSVRYNGFLEKAAFIHLFFGTQLVLGLLIS